MAAGPGLFVSRGGPKLRHALDVFKLEVRGLWCADLGCSTGGFTDCLLQSGAERVFCVDTGYGVLAWKLRQSRNVTVIERANALHVPVHADAISRDVGPGVDLVVMDLGWTPQRLAIPAALRWLPNASARQSAKRSAGQIITLIKPHYELAADEKHLLTKGVLADDHAQRIAERTLAMLPSLGVRVLASTASPVRGSAGKAEGKGNMEWLALVEPATTRGPVTAPDQESARPAVPPQSI